MNAKHDIAADTTADIADTLVITSIEPRPAGGSWVTGTIAGYEFQALAFAEHAINPEHELGDSRLSKLWIGQGGRTIFQFDRGFDTTTRRPEIKAIIDFLAAGLAEVAFATDD